MIISAHISHIDHSAEIGFPMDDDTLDVLLSANKMPTDTTLPFLVEDIHFPAELSCLNGEYVNLDEMNYLAKRLDSFTEAEMEQFGIAVDKTDAKDMKDLINLTFNLNKFTIIKNVGDMAEVGREYKLNREGSVPVDPSFDDEFAAIGRKLLGSGRGIFTEHGLLFIEDEPIEEVYDGQVFPFYWYEPSVVDLRLDYDGKSEMVQLPDSDLAIQKAIRRLGAPAIGFCDYECNVENPQYSCLDDRFKTVLENEGAVSLNALVREIKSQEVDADKLEAAMEMTGVSTSKNIITLINHLDELDLFTGIENGDYDEVGKQFVDHCDDYKLHDDMYDFFDFYEFGRFIAKEYDGQFTSHGFICYSGYDTMDTITNDLEDEGGSMTMGGM